ncbi:hypothetical protein NDU88_003135 [Pleurodeles waltl]|uniref:Uncharacterized protein n=1 Tax=Pleurodeles waltl TaxID=8319 RepID=A0AAV7WN68_PLEWA|nr:hypothetical protein NDU88_003135 [Pleurodeles waltl]
MGRGSRRSDERSPRCPPVYATGPAECFADRRCSSLKLVMGAAMHCRALKFRRRGSCPELGALPRTRHGLERPGVALRLECAILECLPRARRHAGLGAWLKAVPGVASRCGRGPPRLWSLFRLYWLRRSVEPGGSVALGARIPWQCCRRWGKAATAESSLFLATGGNLDLGLLAGCVRGRVAAAVRSPASSGQRGGVNRSPR